MTTLSPKILAHTYTHAQKKSTSSLSIKSPPNRLSAHAFIDVNQAQHQTKTT